MANVPIEGCEDCEQKETDEEHYDRWNDLNRLNQHTRQRPAERLKPKREEPEDAVHAPL
jgi:hypothetical protein